jgi:hypothetical protein
MGTRISHTTCAAKAKACLAKAVPIPGWPLLNMGAAALGSKSDFDLLQNAIDYLSCKAKAKMTFTDEEKAFLKHIFESLWLGGELKGYTEAAQLADHYVNGKGVRLKIDAAVYQTSVIVNDTSAAIKDYVRQLIVKRANVAIVRSSDPGFLYSRQSRRVCRTSGRDVNKQGYLLSDGNLLTEQSNSRLKNANNRFILVAQNTQMGGQTVVTRWRVDDKYVFEPFERADLTTNIPLSTSKVLKLPDGLSQYMCVQKIASEFDYWAEWTETWNA